MATSLGNSVCFYDSKNSYLETWSLLESVISDNVVPCGPIAPLARTVSVDDDFTSPQRFADILETEEPGNTSSISKDFPNLDETQDDPFEKPRHTLILSPSWIPATPDIPISSPKSPPCSPVSRLLESSSSVETPSPMRIASPLNLKKKKKSQSRNVRLGTFRFLGERKTPSQTAFLVWRTAKN
mmetsp:Transcript_39255/g.54728  ORF Transcript_39255/g.54728 Transcript_39255/m.54728 type:complete len:184 (-) Transcript_39255:913-1464(-)